MRVWGGGTSQTRQRLCPAPWTGLHFQEKEAVMIQRNAWVRALGALILAAVTASAQAQAPSPTPPPGTERLVHVVKLWGQIRYLHPWLAYKDVDWDSALVNALPKVR